MQPFIAYGVDEGERGDAADSAQPPRGKTKIEHCMDFSRSLASQRTMCELVACDLIVTGRCAQTTCLPGRFADGVCRFMKARYLLAKTA